MNKLVKKIVPLTILVLGILIGSALSVHSFSSFAAWSSYKVNQNGQTYGGIDATAEPSKLKYPDLIAAIGIDGTEGYVYQKDLDGETPSSPEEALVYMEKLSEDIAKAKESGAEYLYTIPLYKDDGLTVVGQFGISCSGLK